MAAPMSGEHVSTDAARYTDSALPPGVRDPTKILFFNDLEKFSSNFTNLARKVQ